MTPDTLALEIAVLALTDADARVVEAAAVLAEQNGRPDLAQRLRAMVQARTL